MDSKAINPKGASARPHKTRIITLRAAFAFFHLLVVSYVLGAHFPDMIGYGSPQKIGPSIFFLALFAIVQLEFSWSARSIFFRNMLVVLNIFVMIPALAFYHFTETHLMAMQINLFFALFQASGYYQLRQITFTPSVPFLYGIGLAFIGLLLGTVAMSNGLNPEFLTDITLIYSFREEIETPSTIFLSGLIVNLLLPLFILQRFHKGKWTVLIITAIICIMLYISNGHKSVIAFGLIYWIYMYFKGDLIKLILVPTIAILIISIFATLMEYDLLAALLVRRIFLIQPFLFDIWHGEFIGGPIAFWGTIFPLNLFDYYPFQKPLIFIVGELTGGWPNTSIIMDTIVNSGPFFPFFALLFGFLMHVVIVPIKQENRSFVGFLVGFLFINGSFTSVFMNPTTLLLFVALSLFSTPPIHKNN